MVLLCSLPSQKHLIGFWKGRREAVFLFSGPLRSGRGADYKCGLLQKKRKRCFQATSLSAEVAKSLAILTP
jgi:hypothetical protein